VDIIYTIGHKETYLSFFDLAMRRGDVPRKRGRDDDYRGGCAWEEMAQAQAYIDEHEMDEYAVFGVWAHAEKLSQSQEKLNRLATQLEHLLTIEGWMQTP